jgi:phosphoribosylanthranilate isomerase
MQRTRIKICGICRREDAAAAIECGADPIGMVFHAPSPRSVTLDEARLILREVGPFVTAVGLFVDATLEQIQQTTQSLGIHTIQLHGDESPEFIAALKPLIVLKAVRVEKSLFPQTLRRWQQDIANHQLHNLRGLLLETAHTPEPGGTGIPNDWQTVRAARDAGLFNGLPPIIAAGGLTPETVGEVVRAIHPFAVDVSSGVEESRKQKSRQKIAAFVEAVRQAER